MLSPLSVLPLHLACQLLAPENSSLVNVHINTTSPTKLVTEFPKGYIVVPDLGVAYKYYNYVVQWNIARKYCLADGGYLAIADSYEKLQFLMDMNKSGSHLHVGFHKLFDEVEWTDLKTGLPAMAIPWRADPIQEANRFCTVILKDRSGIVAIGCNEAYTFVYTPLPKLATELPVGYTVYPDIGVAYKFHETAVAWHMARKYCNVHGANLAVIDSYEKVQYLLRIRTGSKSVFVGIHRLFDKNEWTDVRTGLAAKAIPWRTESYVDDMKRQCAALFADGDGLYAKVCSLTASFVCEVPIFNN